MSIRTVGVEEEFLLLDPATGRVVDRAVSVLGEADRDDDVVDHELLLDQVETRTDPSTSMTDIGRQLVEARGRIGRAAREAGVAAIASGTSPIGGDRSGVSPKNRYREMVEEFGAIARGAGTCGMHVHVGIDSPEEGVGIIDRLRPWLPVVLALSANSPYADGEDTGYASWRSLVWQRWPTAGPTEPFGDPATYDAVVAALVGSGAARDSGMIYFEARLAAAQPTVEVRVADVCADVDDAMAVAAIVRALCTTLGADLSAPLREMRTPVLRAATWRAARYGLAGTLVDPLGLELRPAREVLESLVVTVRPALEEAGDLDLVALGIDRLLAATGATRQRAAYERTGTLAGVVADLVERSEAVWGGFEARR